MLTELDADSRLQPAKPAHYRLPPIVQPIWRLKDLLGNHGNAAEEALRRELCERYGVRHCLLLDRARSGLYLLCSAFGLDGEWIVTSLMHRPSCVLLQNHCAGLAFADVDDHLTIDPESVERLATPSTSAILATHTYGKSADVVALREVADRNGLFLVENAVHMASGCRAGGRLIGSWGDATVLSFNVDKPLGAILGGALLTNRDDVWEAVSNCQLGIANEAEMRERIRTTFAAYRLKPLVLLLPMGRRHRGAVDGVEEIEKFSADTYRTYIPRRIHPVQARVALACLKRENAIVATRRRNAERLVQLLRDATNLQLPAASPDRPHTYTYFPLILREGSRADFGMRLANAGIETKWRLAPLHLQDGFKNVRRDDLDRSVTLWKRHLLLPAGAATNDQQIDYLAGVIPGH